MRDLGRRLAPVALWLCVADRLALADGVWQISPASSTGVLLLGLPLEEALFFVLTTVLVGDGLRLALSPVALARARRLLPRWRLRPVDARTPADASDGPAAPRATAVRRSVATVGE